MADNFEAIAERDTLERAVSSIHGAAGRANTIPIMECILIVPAAGELRLTASDFTVRAQTAVPADIKQHGAGIAVSARRLKAALGAMPQGSQVALRVTRAALHIACAGNRSRLAGLPAQDYPPEPAFEPRGRFQVAGNALVSMMKEISACAGTDSDARAYLTGVFVQRHDDTRLNLVACDGFVMRVERIETQGKIPEGCPVGILPTGAVNQLPALDAETITVEISEAGMRFTYAGGSMSSKLVEGTYPTWNEIVPSPDRLPNSINLKKADLVRALARVEFAAGGQKGIIAMASTGDRLFLACEDNDGNSAIDAMPLAEAGKPFEVCMTADMMRRLLKTLPDGEMTISTGDPKTACRFDPVERRDSIGCIMPRQQHIPRVLAEALTGDLPTAAPAQGEDPQDGPDSAPSDEKKSAAAPADKAQKPAPDGKPDDKKKPAGKK